MTVEQVQREFIREVQDLQECGYRFLFNSNHKQRLFMKLRHDSNGSYVSLILSESGYKIFRDGILKKEVKPTL